MAEVLMNRLVHRIMNRELRAVAERHFRGRLLDIGCGAKPYAALLSQFVDEHIGVDHAQSPHGNEHVDIVAGAYDIPVRNESFDCALCSAVLEHLEEPEAAIRECFRVLKPGGKAIYLVPFIWHLHEEPRDFYRFSKHGLRYLFEKAGFRIVEIKPLSGFWVTFGQLFVYYMYRYHGRWSRWIPVIPLLGVVVQLSAAVLDRMDRAEEWTWMYMVVAEKP